VAYLGQKTIQTGFWLAKAEEKRSLKNLGVDGKIKLK
jgi:hypothetical protein